MIIGVVISILLWRIMIMKIRTDFVTNSSSSSYCVSYNVKTKDNNSMELDLWYARENGEKDLWGQVGIYTKSKIDDIASQIINSKTVEELKNILINEISLVNFKDDYLDIIEDYNDNDQRSRAELFEKIGEMEVDDFDPIGIEIVDKLNKFNNLFANIKNLEEIQTITITELYAAWGGSAPELACKYIEKVSPEGIDWNDSATVKDALKDKFSEQEIKEMIPCMREGDINMFDASVDTVVDFEKTNIYKNYKFERIEEY